MKRKATFPNGDDFQNFVTTLMCSAFFLQAIMQWQKNTPITFQSFENNNYGKKYPDRFVCGRMQCLQILSPHCMIQCVDLGKLKAEATHRMQPVISPTPTCTLLLMANLAQPEWINIICTQNLLPDVICATNKSNSNQSLSFRNAHNNTAVNSSLVCKTGFLKFLQHCFYFTRDDCAQAEGAKPLASCDKSSSVDSVTNLTFTIREATSAPFSPVIIPMGSQFTVFSAKKHLNIMITRLRTIKTPSIKGYLACQQPSELLRVPEHLLTCERGGYILNTGACDGKMDCSKVSADEAGCFCNVARSPLAEARGSFCKYVNWKNRTSCGLLFHSLPTGICQAFHNNRYKKKSPALGVCPSGIKIGHDMVNDMIVDCEGNVDEPALDNYLRFKIRTKCSSPNLLPCKLGHAQCFSINETCLFKLNAGGRLVLCGNGGNLEMCKQFDCNYHYKCPHSYCISWSYICDDKWDCIEGTDEHYFECKNGWVLCQHKFKCDISRSICVPLSYICDGTEDCANGLDEELCAMKNDQCWATCICVGKAMKCIQSAFSITNLFQLSFVSLAIVQTDIHSEITKIHQICSEVKLLTYDNILFRQFASIISPNK